MFDLKKLKSLENGCLLTSCNKLEEFLTDGQHKDIDGRDLYTELKLLIDGLPQEITRPIDVLNHLMEFDYCYPNAWIAYRVLLTIPVTDASGERSFSKLKLIKNYLRSTMSQERLNGLAMLSIENDLAKKIDYEALIDNFASANADARGARFL